MGLLDDAIREHLELKRRRGADAGEVARQEQEAFGPPQRAELATAPPPSAGEDVAHGPEAVGRDPVALRAAPDPESPAFEDAEEPTRLHAVDDAPAPPPPVAAPDPEPPVSAPPDDQPTRAFDAEEVRAATTPPPAAPPAEAETAPPAPPDPEDGPGEDVLEETPEFLQETPEHDRLWFEQRPPRDFDF